METVSSSRLYCVLLYSSPLTSCIIWWTGSWDVTWALQRVFVCVCVCIHAEQIIGHIEGFCSGATQDVTGLLLLKLDFMRIVCSHEHFVALNLPVSLPITPSCPPSPTLSIASSTSQNSMTSTYTDCGLATQLTGDFRAQHFLVGIVLSDLATLLPWVVSVVCFISHILDEHGLERNFVLWMLKVGRDMMFELQSRCWRELMTLFHSWKMRMLQLLNVMKNCCWSRRTKAWKVFWEKYKHK